MGQKVFSSLIVPSVVGLLLIPAVSAASDTSAMIAIKIVDPTTGLAVPLFSACPIIGAGGGSVSCEDAAEPDAKCSDVAPEITRCDDTWGNSVGYKDLDVLIIYYGPYTNDDAYRTRGADKNYIQHWHAPDDVHDSINWIIPYWGGSAAPGCEEFHDHPGYGAHNGWHGQKLTGSLTQVDAPYPYNQCNTGPVNGIFGAGAEFE